MTQIATAEELVSLVGAPMDATRSKVGAALIYG